MDLTTSQVNDMVFQKVASDSKADMTKVASAVEAFTRTQMKEDGFMRKILPPTPITNADLDRSVTDDRNRVIVDKEPGQGGNAISVPYGMQPAMEYIRTDRYEVPIQRTMTPMYYKDISTFRTDRMDVRQILANGMTKDLLAEEDNKFISVVNYIVAQTTGDGAASTATEAAGMTAGVDGYQTQWVTVNDTAGYPTLEAFSEGMKILSRTEKPLPVSTMLINAVMINDLQKWGLEEIGDDLTGQIAINGWAEKKLLGKRLIVTIKREIVGDLTAYIFAEPKFIGEFFTLEDTTIHMEKENGITIKFYARKEDGAAIGNTLSVGRIDFTGNA